MSMFCKQQTKEEDTVVRQHGNTDIIPQTVASGNNVLAKNANSLVVAFLAHIQLFLDQAFGSTTH